jgi:hypothetical protein
MPRKKGGETSPNSLGSFSSSLELTEPVMKTSVISKIPYRFQINIPAKKPTNCGSLYRLINGIKCFVKYHIRAA